MSDDGAQPGWQPPAPAQPSRQGRLVEAPTLRLKGCRSIGKIGVIETVGDGIRLDRSHAQPAQRRQQGSNPRAFRIDIRTEAREPMCQSSLPKTGFKNGGRCEMTPVDATGLIEMEKRVFKDTDPAERFAGKGWLLPARLANGEQHGSWVMADHRPGGARG